jgi:hypothetical protein
MESQWIPKSSKDDCMGQNSMAWNVFYIIENLLELRCLKWAQIAHLDIINKSYGQKKGQESNWQFDFRPLKFKNQLDLLTYRWRATYRWKAPNNSYNFALHFISIRGLLTKLWHPKVAEVPTLAILGLPLESPKTKRHLDVGPMDSHKIYYKGEGGGFPQVRAVVNLVCPSCLWLILTPKVFQLCINHLMSVLCMSLWVIEPCQLFLVPSRNSSTPLHLPKRYEQGSMPQPLLFWCFLFGTHIWNPRGVGSVWVSQKKGSTNHFFGHNLCCK